MSRIKTVQYDSVAEFIAAASANPDPTKPSHQYRSADFSGTETFDEALTLATRGWPEGSRRLSQLRASLDRIVEKAVTAKSKSLHWDLTGDFLDVGRYMTGEPEAWGEYRDESESHCQTRVIKLIANVSAMATVESSSIFSAGAAIFAAVDLLETLGHRVELWLGSGSTCNQTSKRLQVLVKVKDAGQPFDQDRFAFFLCNNASLRRLFFSVEQDLGFNPNTTRTGDIVPPDGDGIVTPEVDRGISSQKQRADFVIKVCKSVGIEFSQHELQEITA